VVSPDIHGESRHDSESADKLTLLLVGLRPPRYPERIRHKDSLHSSLRVGVSVQDELSMPFPAKTDGSRTELLLQVEALCRLAQYNCSG
jgi:hypothetical protein